MFTFIESNCLLSLQFPKHFLKFDSLGLGQECSYYDQVSVTDPSVIVCDDISLPIFICCCDNSSPAHLHSKIFY